MSPGLFLGLHYSYDLERNVAHVDMASKDLGIVLVVSKQLGGSVIVNHYVFTLVLDVTLVDEPAGNKVQPPDILELGIHTHDLGRKRLLSQTQRVGEVKASVSPVDLLAELLGEGYVSVIEAQDSTFLYSVVRFAGGSRIDGNYVLDCVEGIVHQRVHESVAGSKKHDDDNYAPAHRKPGKGGAQLVLPQGTPYFRKKVEHIPAVYFRTPSDPNRIASCARFSSICPITPSLMWIILLV